MKRADTSGKYQPQFYQVIIFLPNSKKYYMTLLKFLKLLFVVLQHIISLDLENRLCDFY